MTFGKSAESRRNTEVGAEVYIKAERSPRTEYTLDSDATVKEVE